MMSELEFVSPIILKSVKPISSPILYFVVFFPFYSYALPLIINQIKLFEYKY